MCHYSIKATNLDLYQDCPTRERGPYEGDAYINMLSHYAADREFAFARYSNEYLYYRPTWPTEYKQTCLMMAWADYMATGDAKSLAAHYEMLNTKTLIDHVNPQGLIEKQDSQNDRVLVDWPAPYRDGYEFTPINTVTNSFHYKAVELLGRVAGVLGKTDDEKRYRAAAEQVKEAMNQYLFDKTTGLYRDGRDSSHSATHANFFPLAMSIVPAEHNGSVARFLAEKGTACSVYGAQFMLDALYNAGYDGAALTRMTATDMHSWHHMIHTLDATITTEAWDPSGKPNMSFAHPWATPAQHHPPPSLRHRTDRGGLWQNPHPPADGRSGMGKHQDSDNSRPHPRRLPRHRKDLRIDHRHPGQYDSDGLSAHTKIRQPAVLMKESQLTAPNQMDIGSSNPSAPAPPRFESRDSLPSTGRKNEQIAASSASAAMCPSHASQRLVQKRADQRTET